MSERWDPARANAWYDAQPWLVGCNYVPSNAISPLEMWGPDTFDPEANDRELGLAASLGLNTVRVFLHDLLWRDDARGFKARIDRFLGIAHGHGIRPMFVLFDDCWHEPEIGVPDPVPGLHGSGWVRSPGAKALRDKDQWGRLEDYAAGVAQAFGRDERVLMWDVYNELRNEYLPLLSRPQPLRRLSMIATYLRQQVQPRRGDELCRLAFGWVRAADPIQPLTAAIYHPWDDLNALLTGLSDIVSFHDYEGPGHVREQIRTLREAHGRPVLCTEWLSRAEGSTVQTILPLFEEERVGCYHWGLVDGKTQTKFGWQNRPTRQGPAPEPELWFHDLLRADGSPYREEEAALFRKLTSQARASVATADPVQVS